MSGPPAASTTLRSKIVSLDLEGEDSYLKGKKAILQPLNFFLNSLRFPVRKRPKGVDMISSSNMRKILMGNGAPHCPDFVTFSQKNLLYFLAEKSSLQYFI